MNAASRPGPASPQHPENTAPAQRYARGAIAGAAVIFGALTVLSGGMALFGGPAARAAVGAAVPFVLWFNFLAGFAYVLAGVGIMLKARWAAPLSAAIAVATLAVFAAFGWHVLAGGPYEMRTVGAMALRCVVWSAIAIWACRTLRCFGRAPEAA